MSSIFKMAKSRSATNLIFPSQEILNPYEMLYTIEPVRCYTCSKVLGSVKMYELYAHLLKIAENYVRLRVEEAIQIWNRVEIHAKEQINEWRQMNTPLLTDRIDSALADLGRDDSERQELFQQLLDLYPGYVRGIVPLSRYTKPWKQYLQKERNISSVKDLNFILPPKLLDMWRTDPTLPGVIPDDVRAILQTNEIALIRTDAYTLLDLIRYCCKMRFVNKPIMVATQGEPYTLDRDTAGSMIGINLSGQAMEEEKIAAKRTKTPFTFPTDHIIIDGPEDPELEPEEDEDDLVEEDEINLQEDATDAGVIRRFEIRTPSKNPILAV